MIAKSSNTPNTADWSDVAELQKRMAESSEALSAMAGDVGNAKHILEYDSDLRKRALARAMAAPLAGGATASKAEAEGRASDGYTRELEVLANQHKAAEQAVMQFEVEKIRWETARSLLAMIRTQVGQV